MTTYESAPREPWQPPTIDQIALVDDAKSLQIS